jgi:hypothetical protein
MKRFILFVLVTISGFTLAFAQVGINADGSNPDGSAMLDIKSTNKGMLLPRMTASEITTIATPANGLVVYCTTDDKLYIYVSSGLVWKEISYGTNILGASFPCGLNITMNHMAGPVAPVSKTVTYGTVSNIPGEPSKCWITRNLGADQQATAVSDATEASAGWYWQFNRKQGYKHDGTTRTPNTVWITNIVESSDWITANDPCTLELGAGWRIPTYTEWFNVDNTGGWANWNGPWNSGLKMHAAGYLSNSGGSLGSRGSVGHYWSSTQSSNTGGWGLDFLDVYSSVPNGSKAYGYTLRCVRE